VADSKLYEHVDKVRQHNLDCVFHGDGLCPTSQSNWGVNCVVIISLHVSKEKGEQNHLLLHLITFIDCTCTCTCRRFLNMIW
jgi:hypothetical protein